jgi:uncharacterized protein (DUF1330 family)
MVYQILDLDVHNPAIYAKYTAQVTEIIHRYGGQYLVRGGKVLSATGGWEPKRIVVIAFESVEDLRNCYASPEYQAIVHLRQQSSTSKTVVVEGIAE